MFVVVATAAAAWLVSIYGALCCRRGPTLPDVEPIDDDEEVDAADDDDDDDDDFMRAELGRKLFSDVVRLMNIPLLLFS